MTKALLVVAHGSRRAQSNQEVLGLAESLAQQLKQQNSDVALVEAAFLELAEPLVPSAIEKLYAQGCRELVFYPHFLAAGTHVVNDLPRLTEQAKQRFPDLEVHSVSHLGGMPGLAGFIAGQL